MYSKRDFLFLVFQLKEPCTFVMVSVIYFCNGSGFGDKSKGYLTWKYFFFSSLQGKVVYGPVEDTLRSTNHARDRCGHKENVGSDQSGPFWFTCVVGAKKSSSHGQEGFFS